MRAINQNGRHAKKRLDIVDHGRLAEEALGRHMRRFVPRDRSPAFKGVEHGGSLTTNVTAGTGVHVEFQIHAGAEDVFTEIVVRVCLVNGLRQTFGRFAVQSAQEDIGRFSLDCIGCHDDPFDELMRAALH